MSKISLKKIKQICWKIYRDNGGPDGSTGILIESCGESDSISWHALKGVEACQRQDADEALYHYLRLSEVIAEMRADAENDAELEKCLLLSSEDFLCKIDELRGTYARYNKAARSKAMAAL